RHHARLLTSRGSYFQTGYRGPQTGKLLAQIEVHIRVLVVIFVHPCLESTRHLQPPNARDWLAGYRTDARAAECRDVHAVSEVNGQPLGQRAAEHDTVSLTVAASESEVALLLERPNLSHRRLSRIFRGNAGDIHTFRINLALLPNDALLEDERRGRRHRLDFANPGKLPLPVVNSHVAIGQYANVRAANKDLLTQAALQSVHHSHDEDERAHSHHHTADGDHADHGQQSRASTAAQISPGYLELQTGQRFNLRGAWSETGLRHGCAAYS